MATKPKNTGWSSSLRKGFNLEAEEEAGQVDPPPDTVPPAASKVAPAPLPDTSPPPPEPTPAPVGALAAPAFEPSPVPAPGPVDLVPLTTGTGPGRERGRPRSTIERFPKTIYLTPRSELGLRRSVEQMQEWRGRRRGVLKVQESEAANFALEYLYRRINEGQQAAEAFFDQFQAAERTRFESAPHS